MKNFKRKSSPGKGKGPKNNFNRFEKKDSGTFRKPSYDKFNRKDSRPGKFESDNQLHEATCDSCGKTCGVPFKPNGKKAVYCSLCFKKGNKSESESHYGKDDFKKPTSNAEITKKEFQELNRKLDTILKLLQEK